MDAELGFVRLIIPTARESVRCGWTIWCGH